MIRYIGWRLLQIVPVLFGVSVIAFLLLRLIPGDPAVTILGDRATPQLVARLHREMGLDAPIWVQYLNFLGRAIHGDFGTSFIYRTQVFAVTMARIPLSLLLISYAALMALAIAIPLATIAALKRGRLIDQAIRLLFTTTLGIPSFWLAIMLILLLGVGLKLFPVGGQGDGGLDTLWHLTLPAFTIGLAMSPILVRSLRSSLIEVLGADYVTTGKAMGLSGLGFTWSYLLRNSILPVILVLSIHVGWLLSGTVIVEQIFGLPGVGSLLISSISTRDYAFIQLVALLFAMMVILVNLATDLLYAALDPRVSLRR